MRNLSYENEYDLHSNGLVSKTHFHMKGFALGLVLKQRQKTTRKWPIKAAEQYFPVAMFIMLYKVVLTFEYVDEILKCDHSSILKQWV